MVAVGYSLGATLLTKDLAEAGEWPRGGCAAMHVCTALAGLAAT